MPFKSSSCDATATSLGQRGACRPSIHAGLCEKPVSVDTFSCIGKLPDPWLSISLGKLTGHIGSFFSCLYIDLRTGVISRGSEAAASSTPQHYSLQQHLNYLKQSFLCFLPQWYEAILFNRDPQIHDQCRSLDLIA